MTTTTSTRRARATGTVVSVIDNRDGGFDANDLPWFTVCEDRGGVCSHPTRKLAEEWAPHPDEWCPTCQEDGQMTETVTTKYGVTARRMPPTLGHRLAVAPGILGTVYGVNAAGEARYFDYDWAAAAAFAGVTQDGDPRLARPRGRYAYIRSGCTEANPKPAATCLWVRKDAPR